MRRFAREEFNSAELLACARNARVAACFAMEVLQADGAEAWHRVCSETFVPLETVTGERFHGTIEHVQMDGVSVSRVMCDPCLVSRSKRTILAAPRSEILVNFMDHGIGGLRAVHDTVLTEGQASLCEADRAYALHFEAPVTVLTLQLERSLLTMKDARIRDAHARLIPNAARLAILRQFLIGILEAGRLGLDHRTEYGFVARDLLVLALHQHEQVDSTIDQDSAYVLFQSFLQRHFADPELTIEKVARLHRISRRYMEGVFARHGHSPAAYLRSLRVDQACKILAARQSTTIAETARLVGFNDVATFSRAFRRATGSTPDAWRQRDHLASLQSLAIESTPA
jgi:AraC-like DNA-binding protein